MPRGGRPMGQGVNVTAPAATGAARRKRQGAPEAYDFRRPMTLAREHGRVLERAFETFARQWGTLLTSRTRVVAQISLEHLDLRSYEEYIRPLPSTSLMVVCGVEPGRSAGVLQLPVDTGMVLIDYLLGGPGMPLDEPERELTEIEWQLLRDLLQHALHEVTYAFTAVTPLEVVARQVQYAPQFVQAAAASTPVIVATFALDIGSRSDTATLMLPAEALLAPLRAGEHKDNRTAAELHAHELALEALRARVGDVPVDVSVRFRPVALPAARVDELRVGDVIGLRHRSDQPLDVVVDDVVMATAALGSNGTRLACLVVTSEENA